jgi:hypothetical protein
MNDPDALDAAASRLTALVVVHHDVIGTHGAELLGG